MALTLRVENQTSLPDGGPLGIRIDGKRGIDIGRDQHLDWTLPDANRVVSSKHCQIRWRDNAYWLHDISSNGTFLLGAETRLPVPYRIRNGDRFVVGDYIISATIDGEAADVSLAAGPNSKLSYDNVWDAVGEVAAPINPKQLKAPRDLQPTKPDFLDWAVDVPSSSTPVPTPSPASPRLPPKEPLDDMSWARGTKQVSGSEPQPPSLPQPRRPVWTAGEAEHPWGGSPRAATQPTAANDDAWGPGAAPRARADREPPNTPPDDLAGLPGAKSGDVEWDFVRSFSCGAGLPDDALAGCDPAHLAKVIGQLLQVLTENTKQLLEDRQQAKQLARSLDHTTIQATENNPLKFAPTSGEAMRLMFGPPTRSYLDARAAFTQAFDNLKSHQVQTYSAMQQAVTAVLAEFNPNEIEKNANMDRTLADMFGSHQGRLWDVYVLRWKVCTQSKKDGILGGFMNYFAENYDTQEFKRSQRP